MTDASKPRVWRRRLSWAGVGGLLVTTLTVTVPATALHLPKPHRASPTPAAPGPVTVAAAGDIACSPSRVRERRTCRDAATARLIRSQHVDAVIPLGDEQYESGRLQDFRRAYDRTWGAFKAISHPVPGNHEYRQPGASGYFRYFGRRAHGPRGYYAYNLGRWRVYALNTNCARVNCAEERRWLRKDLRAHPRRRCSLAAMHQPTFSSGGHGDIASSAPFFSILDAHDVEVALAGHDHVYERFSKMHVSGAVSARGVQSFVVGTGGKELGSFRREHRGSRFRETRFGALFLRLGDGTYSWKFRATNGVVRDSGAARCMH